VWWTWEEWMDGGEQVRLEKGSVLEKKRRSGHWRNKCKGGRVSSTCRTIKWKGLLIIHLTIFGFGQSGDLTLKCFIPSFFSFTMMPLLSFCVLGFGQGLFGCFSAGLKGRDGAKTRLLKSLDFTSKYIFI